jgi:hypothetical protein
VPSFDALAERHEFYTWRQPATAAAGDWASTGDPEVRQPLSHVSGAAADTRSCDRTCRRSKRPTDCAVRASTQQADTALPGKPVSMEAHGAEPVCQRACEDRRSLSVDTSG